MGFESPTTDYFDDNTDGKGESLLSRAQHQLRFKSNG